MLLKSALNQQFTETPIIQVILVIRHFHISHNGTLFAPPKFCLTFVFHFSWVFQPFQEKLKTT